MSRVIIFRRAARAEFEEAVAWYEGQRSGLGRRFRRAVDAVVGVIVRQPERYPEVHDEAREAPVSGFPYSVFYQATEDTLHIVAVFHAARDPQEWQSRL